MRISNEGYDTFGIGFFYVKDSPDVLNWLPLVTHPDKIPHIEKAFQAELTSKVKNYELKKIPARFSRSVYDHATLLILHLQDGNVIAKRHNDNQVLRLKNL